MSSTSQISANRENAHFSTGPVTPEGKSIASENSLKHGLASGRLLIPGENPEEFQQLLSSLADEHQPATPTEEILVEKIAQAHWLTQRSLPLQADLFSTGDE